LRTPRRAFSSAVVSASLSISRKIASSRSCEGAEIVGGGLGDEAEPQTVRELRVVLEVARDLLERRRQPGGRRGRRAHHGLGELAVLVQHVVAGAHVSRVERRAQVRVHELDRERQDLAVARVDGRLADVARVDGHDVGHLGERLERLAEDLADLAQAHPFEPGAVVRQLVQ